MNRSIRTNPAVPAVLAGALLSLSLVAPAAASGGDGRVQRSGSCSDGAVWKLKAKPDDGRMEVEAEVDSNVTGQRWAWRITHDGGVSAKGTARTLGPSGSFSVERRLVDGAGSDTFGFRAVDKSSGQVCRGSVTL